MAEQYWYPGGLTDADFATGPTSSGWAPQSFIYGASISVGGTAGTATLIGVRCYSNGANFDAKVGLYTSGGTLVAQSTITGIGATAAWRDAAAISAAVSPGTYVVMVSASTSDGGWFYNTGGNGIGETVAYASAMPGSITTTADEIAFRYGVRVYVVEDEPEPETMVWAPVQQVVRGPSVKVVASGFTPGMDVD